MLATTRPATAGTHLVGLLAAVALAAAPAVDSRAAVVAQPASATRLRIVVVAGEDGVNVIQQKTAVAPVVEVRDDNDQPVAGVLVRFAARVRGGAPVNGLSSLSATTDAAGRATVPAFAPSSAGPLQIDVTAISGEQTATVTINQTTYETAADAARATRDQVRRRNQQNPDPSSGASNSGGGFGLGKTLMVLGVGAAAGAGGYVASQRRSDGSTPPQAGAPGGGGTGPGPGDGGGTNPTPPPVETPTTQAYTVSSPFTMQIPFELTSTDGFSCRIAQTFNGAARVELQVVRPPGSASGRLTITPSGQTATYTCNYPADPTGLTGPATSQYLGGVSTAVTGAESTLSARQTGQAPNGNSIESWEATFTGALNGSAVTGTLSYTFQCTGASIRTCAGQASIPLSLR